MARAGTLGQIDNDLNPGSDILLCDLVNLCNPTQGLGFVIC